MKPTISNRGQWREVLRQQMLANVQHWLGLLENNDDPTSIAIHDYDNVLRALETTLQEHGSFDLAYRLVQCLHFVALDYADWDRWLFYLQKTLATSEQLGLLPEQAKLLVQIGEIHYRKGELADAETLYVKGAGKCKELGDLSGYASTLAKLGALRDMQGFMNEGIALCQEAIAIAESINDGWVVAQADLNLSNIYRRALNWTPGLEAAQRAYDFFKGRSRGQFANKALVNIVALWAELGEWQKVDHVSDELMESLIAAGDVRTLSQLKNNLGVVAFDQENYQAAEASWQEALRLNSQIQEPTELANLYNNLGVVYTRMREWEAAEEMLKMAAKAHRELGDAYNGANSLDNLADMYEAKGDTAACRRVLEEAEDGLLALVDNPHAEDLRRNIRERLASLPVS